MAEVQEEPAAAAEPTAAAEIPQDKADVAAPSEAAADTISAQPENGHDTEAAQPVVIEDGPEDAAGQATAGTAASAEAAEVPAAHEDNHAADDNSRKRRREEADSLAPEAQTILDAKVAAGEVLLTIL